jgi:DNA invertase Pin-like site-specific DNA recombinase
MIAGMTPTVRATRTGREYLRVSKDRSGRQCSISEQHNDNQGAADERDVTLGVPYAEDRAVSASRYGRKTRGGFGKLLADLRSGRFKDDELWLWESGRGSRRVSEWVELVELCEKRGVCVFVTTHRRLYDPANARDRRSLLEDAVDSEYEVAKLSQRTRRAHAALAAAGRPNGRAPYGYRRVYDPQTREGRQEIEPGEAAVVRELFTRLGAGDSLHGIARDFAARGIRSRTGKTLSIQYLRQWAIRAAYAGRRVHRPNDGGPATVTEGTWPAVVEPVLFDRVQQILSDPARKTRRPGRANHLLSLIAVCNVCGDGLIARCRRRGDRAGVWELQCRAGNHVTVPEAALDAYAEKAMFTYLARADVADQLHAAVTSGPELDQVRLELAEVRRQLDELYEQVAARKVSAAALAAIEPRLLAEADQLEAQRRELSAPPALAGLIAPGTGAKRRWAKMPMSAKREVARLLLCPDLLGQLRIARAKVTGRLVPVEQRVVWRTSS